MKSGPLATILPIVLVLAASQVTAQTLDLPSSKQLIEPVPGHPQSLNSLPMSMAISPDGRFVVTVNAGLGTFESHYDQSLAVLDTRTGIVSDFPDDRTLIHARQTLYSGLAFSRDGSHLYASVGSISDPLATGAPVLGIADIGSGILVYHFADKPYYMPLPDADYVEAHRDTLFDLSADRYDGIALDGEGQQLLLSALAVFQSEMPFRRRTR